MSGICGFADWGAKGITSSALSPMMAAAPYRSKDGQRVAGDSLVSMGYQALNITPQSYGEVQPLCHRATGIIICADARLDNREELLHEEGADAGDASILLSLYLRHGDKWAERVLGDFAVSIWDPRKQIVQLARDAMGMRPLYCFANTGVAVWGSEIRQILAFPNMGRALNNMAVSSYLSGINLPVDMSFYKDIHPVEPGCSVTIGKKGKNVKRFWEMDSRRKIRYKRESEYTEQFKEIFLESVRCRMRSRQPVGISLSGGVDSGSAAACAGWLLERESGANLPDVRTYSWAYEELSQCDERDISRQITERYSLPAVDIPAEDSWPLKDYPLCGPHYDDPIFGIYQYLLERTMERAAGDGCSLVLSGDRGDLLVGGTVLDFPGLFLTGRLDVLIREARQLKYYTDESYKHILWNRLLRSMAGKVLMDLGRTWEMAPPSPLARLGEHICSDFIRSNSDFSYVPRSLACRSSDRAVRERFKNIFTEMHMHGMIWSERTNAKYGIGFADAWSDRRLAEFILSIPQHLVNRISQRKRIAVNAMGEIMTKPMAASLKKISPEPLYIKAIREKSMSVLREHSRNMVSAEAGYINERVFRDKVEKLIKGEIPMFDLWPALSLEMWLRRYWT